jgi:hypothetical protein
LIVIPGLVPGTHDLRGARQHTAAPSPSFNTEIMGGRDKPGHDDQK